MTVAELVRREAVGQSPLLVLDQEEAEYDRITRRGIRIDAIHLAGNTVVHGGVRTTRCKESKCSANSLRRELA